MNNSKPIDTPSERTCLKPKCYPNDEKKNSTSKVSYGNGIGILMYAILCTRPDISFIIGMVTWDLFIGNLLRGYSGVFM